MPTSPAAGMAPKKPPCGSTVSICRTGCATRPGGEGYEGLLHGRDQLLYAQDPTDLRLVQKRQHRGTSRRPSLSSLRRGYRRQS